MNIEFFNQKKKTMLERSYFPGFKRRWKPVHLIREREIWTLLCENTLQQRQRPDLRADHNFERQNSRLQDSQLQQRSSAPLQVWKQRLEGL